MQGPRLAAAPASLISAPNAVDFVDNPARDLLYITSGSQILRYTSRADTFLSSLAVGGNLQGIDLSPNGAGHLLVADSNYTSSTAWFYDVNPTSEGSSR